MPKIEFQERGTGTVKVRGQDQAPLATASSGVGPQGFPPPPPPPPPTPVPLTVVSIVHNSGSEFVGTEIVFDSPPAVTGIPNWTPTGDSVWGVGFPDSAQVNGVTLLTDTGDAAELVIPADSTGVKSSTGGSAVAGTYPIPFPP